MTTTLEIANRITKALFPETYGVQRISLQQAAALIGARGLIEDVLRSEMFAWQPIETAPKDGSPCIITNGAAVGEGWYSADNDGWWWAQTHPTDAIDGSVWQPTYWMPLPELPK